MKTRKGLLAAVCLIIVLNVLPVFADVKLPAIIGDNMLLQQKTKAPIWGWAEPGEKVSVKGSWQWFGASTKADSDGKWSVKLSTPKASKGHTIAIKANNTITLEDVLIGEVWICSGQSNMHFLLRNSDGGPEAAASADYPDIRLFTVKAAFAKEPQTDCTGQWSKCSPETTPDFSAVGYYFGKELHTELDIPIGLIHTSWGGTPAEAWTRQEILESDTDFAPILERQEQMVRNLPQALEQYETALERWPQQAKKAREAGKKAPRKPQQPTERNQRSPSSLYNAMIAPLIPYSIKGAIWYQGEANAARAYQYRKLFPAMIANWRQDWDRGDFPFYFVQIAPFNGQNPEIRESQMLTMKTVKNTGMAVTMDIGNPENIHPANKQDVGKRLSLWALAKNYGKKNLVYSGPIYEKMKVDGNKIKLYFDHIGGGLLARGGALTDFTIAGKDKQFTEAKATIDGDTIIVSSRDVKNPVSVRFGWTNAAEPNLFNKEGLPASPFRTDDWPGETFDAR